MSVFCLSTSAFFASRSATARSYSRAFSIFIAVALFFPWLRSCWHDTTIPVGRWVMRTADEVLLTCCPPLPDARVVVLDLDFDFVVHFGIDEHRRERRVAPRLRVEG